MPCFRGTVSCRIGHRINLPETEGKSGHSRLVQKQGLACGEISTCLIRASDLRLLRFERYLRFEESTSY